MARNQAGLAFLAVSLAFGLSVAAPAKAWDLQQGLTDLGNGAQAVGDGAAHLGGQIVDQTGKGLEVLRKGIEGPSSACNDGSHPYNCPGPGGTTPNSSDGPGRTDPVQVVDVDGSKIVVLLENRASSATFFEIYDVNGHGWVFAKMLSPGEIKELALVKDENGFAHCNIRRDRQRGLDTSYDFLRPGEHMV